FGCAVKTRRTVQLGQAWIQALAADSADGVVRIKCCGPEEGVAPGRRKAGIAWVSSVERSSFEIRLDLYMPRVRPALVNCINHASESAAILRLEAARLDLNFFHEIHLKVFSDTANLDICRIDAVDQIHIFAIRGTIDLETIRTAAVPAAL